jgi:hypothetical protein
MGPRTLEAVGLKAHLERFFPFEQVDGHMAQVCKIFLCMVSAYPAVVFAEGYVQAPVKAVFDAPMISDEFDDGRGAVLGAGDKIGRFDGHPTVDIALSNGHADGVNARPVFFSLKPADIAGCKVASGFDAAVLCIEGFESVERSIGGLLEEKGDVFVQRLLIVFDLDHIIGACVDNRLGDFF